MAKYEKDDIVTYWFVIMKDNDDSCVQAWTDDKDLLNYYIDFHKCKLFKVKKITDTMQNIYEILNNSAHDEIGIYYVNIKNPNPKPGKEFKTIAVPMTETESRFVQEECSTFLATKIPYSQITHMIGFLKNKYQHALEGILFIDVMRTVLAEQRPTPLLQSIMMDELRILFESFPDKFGI